MTKSEVIMQKIGAFTQHGKARQEARAISYAAQAKDRKAANKLSPGISFLKGSPEVAILQQLLARRNAYQASGGMATQLKSLIPFVGMGPKGQEALNKLSYVTQHGKAMQESKALAFSNLADAYQAADDASPGLSYLKGTMYESPLAKMRARRQAYVANSLENQVKAIIPFVGMGSKGQEYLTALKNKKK